MLAWLAWAFLTATITLEVLSRLRRMPTPHLPALALPQSAARGLVGAAVLLFAAALPATPSRPAAQAASTAPMPTLRPRVGRLPAISHHGATGTQSTKTDRNRDGTRTHTVTSGESLWSIAHTELGDGARWHEIADLNPGTPRPAMAGVAGTTLSLPTAHSASDASRQGGATYLVRPGDTLSEIAQEQLGDADRYPDLPGLGFPHQADGRHLKAGSDPSRVAADHPRQRRQGRCRASSGGSAAARGPREPGNRPAITGSKPADAGPATTPPSDESTPATTTRPTQRTPQARPSRTTSGQALDDCRPGGRCRPGDVASSRAGRRSPCWPGLCGCCCGAVARADPPPTPRTHDRHRAPGPGAGGRPSPPSGLPPKTPLTSSTGHCAYWPATTPRPTFRCPPSPPSRSACTT